MARILVVDDEEMDRVLVRSILESAGHELLFASDGEGALKILRDEPLDLVVTDLAMPEFNGLRFIKEMREEDFRHPVVAISGWAADQLDLAESYGADATLFKPINGDELLNTVNSILNLPTVEKRKDPWGRGR
jgi:CheY-like chemotaxis protein